MDYNPQNTHFSAPQKHFFAFITAVSRSKLHVPLSPT